MTPCTVWIGGQYPATPDPGVMLMMTPIISNKHKIMGLIPMMKRRPGLSYEEIAQELGMTKKAVAVKMDKLQLRGVVWFKHEQRKDKKGTPHRTKVWFTAKEQA